MKLSVSRAGIALATLACAGVSHAHEAYRNLPAPSPNPPGGASNVEHADDLLLDLSGGSIVESATLRIIRGTSTPAPRIRLNIYTDNAGQPGALLSTVAVTIPASGPSQFDQLFDLPDVALTSPSIWAGYVFETSFTGSAFVGASTLPTIGSTTARGAIRLGPSSWNVQGASGPPSSGYYAGDRLQIGITTIPAPGASALALAALVGATRRRRA